MIIAAIDVSDRGLIIRDYEVTIHNILSSLKFPLRIIQWSDCIYKDTIYNNIESFFDFKLGTKRVPKSFMRRLPNDEPFELYLFTNGKINDQDVKECRFFLKRRNIQITYIHLHYIGTADKMNLKFTDIFYGYPQPIYLNGESKATFDINNLKEIDYNFIMKDDSLKAIILTQINSPDVDNNHLKNEFTLLTKYIFKKYLEKNLTICKFYAQHDVEGCIAFVKQHAYYPDKAKFQKKMSNILKLFDPYLDTYSLKHFETVQNDKNVNKKKKKK